VPEIQFLRTLALNPSSATRLEAMSQHRYVPPFYFATIYLARGNIRKTFEWGWKSIGERSDYLIYLRVRVEPRVGKLAGRPEFIKALSRLHL
jgi:hypothetical protein